MKREDVKDKLFKTYAPKSLYDTGIDKANRIAKIWINKTFDYFEKEIESYEKHNTLLDNMYDEIQIRNHDLVMTNIILKGTILEIEEEVKACTGSISDNVLLYDKVLGILEEFNISSKK